MHLIVVSNKSYHGDFRKYLALAAEADGIKTAHLQIHEGFKVSWQGEEQFSADRETPVHDVCARIMAHIGSGRGICLTGMNGFRSPAAMSVKPCLPGSFFYFDVYDDFRYGSSGKVALKWAWTDMRWRLHTDRRMVLEKSLLWRYPGALHLDNASQVQRPAPSSSPREGVVYSGSIDHRTDFDLLKAVADTGASLDMYGAVHVSCPSAEDWISKMCAAHPHVRYFGSYVNDHLGEILAKYRIGLVPYKTKSPLTRHINPDKIYHYLNAGLEVVATDIPQTRRMASFLHLLNKGQTAEKILQDANQGNKTNSWDVEANSWPQRWKVLKNDFLRRAS